jgi:hypothetical protein
MGSFLPLASGASGVGVLFVLMRPAPATNVDYTGPSIEILLFAIGFFGFVITLGLFANEIRALQRMFDLIRTGLDLERGLGIAPAGQFSSLSRASDIFGRTGGYMTLFVGVGLPLAARIVYGTLIAAWAFVAVVMYDVYLAGGIAFCSLIVSYIYSGVLLYRGNQDLRRID